MADNDSWFDRVPGNYYKGKPQPPAATSDSRQDRSRHSGDYDDRRSQYDDNYERRRDDRRRDSHRSRSSYDKGDRRYDGPEPRRNDDRYGYNDGYGRQNDRSYDDQLESRRDYRRPASQRFDEPVRADSPLTAAATGGLAAGIAAGIAATRMNDELHAPQPRAAEPAYTGYVPYSNIYGSAKSNGPQTAFSTPPAASVGSPQPHMIDCIPEERRSRAYDGPYDDRYDQRSRERRDPRARSYDSYDSRDDYRKGRRDDDYAERRERARERRRENARNIEYARDEAIIARREQRENERREKNGDWKD
ncbi:hypothetical protein AMS68_006568 [Peltaster fructicola]|uniref:Uncharacterized protein n=1 Tax=Peltaster fructicola TaxID=286661 RepID=A0A6H0Y2A5_9PEZI|nr:hypothetical protein AMS68_006568 [Peltaster fructicola]